jgi:hypothetical protein
VPLELSQMRSAAPAMPRRNRQEGGQPAGVVLERLDAEKFLAGSESWW